MENKKEAIGLFPTAPIRISLIVAGVLIVAGGIMMRNQAFFNAKFAGLAAAVGLYDVAQEFVNEIDADTDKENYCDGVYHIADAMLSAGKYDHAQELFVGLGDYSDSTDRSYECVQKKAEALMKKGDYLAASDLLVEIMFFKGSKELYQECQYNNALSMIDKGEWLIGAKILWNIRDYRDSQAIAEKTVFENTGSDNVEETVGGGNAIAPEILSDYIALTENRKQLRDGAIATGFYHTVGLKKDGSVLSCGSNDRGQCDTGAWSNVVQIAAGGYHTAALLSDGTVVACGDNKYGQCNVGSWKDVIQIKATDYNTIALLKDGTVKTCGYNKLTQTQGWSGIERICSGAYALCGIAMNGELYATHHSCRMEGQLLDADASVAYAIGLDYGGKIVYTSDTPCDWTKAVAVFAGGETVGVIKPDFTPAVYHRRKRSLYELPDKPAASMSLGGTHFAVLYSDGSVYCDGENEFGQCDTSDWNLN